MALIYKIQSDVYTLGDTGALGLLKTLTYKELTNKKDIRKIIRTALRDARKEVMTAAQGAMQADPRKARLGVKIMIYKKEKGGNVSLLSGKSSGKTVEYSLTRGGVSGIIRHRNVSARTRQMNSYHGKDRAFILRFLNDGTTQRKTLRALGAKQQSIKGANRGAITARNFFAAASASGMQKATVQISARIDALIKEVGAERI